VDIDAYNSRENIGLSAIDFDCHRYLLLLIDHGGGKRRADIGLGFGSNEKARFGDGHHRMNDKPVKLFLGGEYAMNIPEIAILSVLIAVVVVSVWLGFVRRGFD
jgi:hypothetical protein